ncbi:hypothetical protein [Mucilaginibacter sp.]|uniref:hypothetical protein n=1 Tax=Mucilaginibacter sp. TaxID=1882438 RepID=UPI0025E7E6E7|nr:hypothetical protein [Mucilaginibacter sp.]
MKPLNTNIETRPYNKEVRKAFNQILTEAKAMLAGIEKEELRNTLSREIKPATRNMLIYEFISPLIYLSIHCSNEELFTIHYGFERGNANHELCHQTAYFTRAVYSATSKEHTKIDIEGCVQNDWCIIDCSALYEYMEDRGINHKFSLIKYKPAAGRRKMQAVA